MQLMLRSNSVQRPISLDMIKAHLRLDGDDEDDVLNDLIDTATEMVERYLGVTLIEKTWLYRIVPDASGVIDLALPMGPLLEIESVHQLMPNGKRPVMRRFYVDYTTTKPSFRCSSHVPIEILYRSGFGQIPTHIPSTLKHAVKLLVSHFYENRVNDTDIPDSIKHILSGFKMNFI